jgi:lipopolysaccharide assembly outer membrane protein LptD (OstA)
MKRLLAAVELVGLTAFLAQGTIAQNTDGGSAVKHYLTTLPDGKGKLSVSAGRIDKEWVPETVHFKGDVRVVIDNRPKDAKTSVIFVKADEVDLQQKTGEISARGNVQITVGEVK